MGAEFPVFIKSENWYAPLFYPNNVNLDYQRLNRDEQIPLSLPSRNIVKSQTTINKIPEIHFNSILF